MDLRTANLACHVLSAFFFFFHLFFLSLLFSSSSLFFFLWLLIRATCRLLVLPRRIADKIGMCRVLLFLLGPACPSALLESWFYLHRRMSRRVLSEIWAVCGDVENCVDGREVPPFFFPLLFDGQLLFR